MTTLTEAMALFKGGESLYIPGSSAEPGELTRALSEQREDLPELRITHSFVPGVNTRALASTSNKVQETCFFPRKGELMAKGKVDFLPLSYFGAQRYLQDQSFDWACIQVSPPDADGNCCLAPSVEFLPTVLGRAKKTLALINNNVPRISSAPKVNMNQLDVHIESDEALSCYRPAVADPISDKIAERLLTLIEPGAVLQLGLGNVPSQLTDRLAGLDNLRFHSGLVSDGFIKLWKAGALDPDFKHTICCALGTENLYSQLSELDILKIAGVHFTHDPRTLAQYDRLTAINTALEVDLWGQANLEMLGGRQLSSVGGAADFSRAARNSANGKSIIALPATAAKGTVSRIKSMLSSGQVVSLARCDIDYVVTEYGVAKLKGKAISQRAEALIQIAAPQFQNKLESDWRALLNKL